MKNEKKVIAKLISFDFYRNMKVIFSIFLLISFNDITKEAGISNNKPIGTQFRFWGREGSEQKIVVGERSHRHADEGDLAAAEVENGVPADPPWSSMARNRMLATADQAAAARAVPSGRKRR